MTGTNWTEQIWDGKEYGLIDEMTVTLGFHLNLEWWEFSSVDSIVRYLEHNYPEEFDRELVDKEVASKILKQLHRRMDKKRV